MKNIKVFFDTEFTGLHQNTTIISLGLVTQDNWKFYAEFIDYDKDQIDDWIKDNVLSSLLFKDSLVSEKTMRYGELTKLFCKGDSKYIRKQLETFLEHVSFNGQRKIEFWSDCLSYDWVLFNQLWDGALNIPDYIYYIPFDICTLFKIKDIDPDINREDFVKEHIDKNKIKKHNALWDAEIIRLCYYKLMRIE